MKKSSRFWWLHGAILVAAVSGCKSNSCCNSSPYGGGQSGPPPAVGTSGPIGSAGGTMYNQSSMTMPGGASAMPAGQSFAPQGGSMYSGPGLSSGAGAHF
jgi:hypothetical protein